MGGWMKAWVCDSQVNGWMDGDRRVDRWMMDRRMIDGWNGEMDVCMHEWWMDGWIMGRYNILGKHYVK